MAERSQDLDKDGFINLGSGSDTFVYNGTSFRNPLSHKTYTFYAGQKVNAGAGDDTVTTSNGDDVDHGGSGRDVLSSGYGQDKLYGGSGNDWLFGGAGDDTISGGSGNDTLDGDHFFQMVPGGNDRLEGGSGDDSLYGGAGFDVLIGGSGADTFSFAGRTDSSIWQPDQIRDFDRAEGDEIYMPSFYLNNGKTLAFTSGPSTQAGKIWITQVDATHDRVYVNFDGGAADMEVDVTLAHGSAHLTAADFVV